ncbi:hypothetical protein U879_12370 [Defluviimonas sp. 20V17]|uniref:LPS sulfotransferase NodH n=1 Tax=Allgaiera indica TaxID=765699 RepID=A0AAN4ZXV5_9RHOB|nr:sulfotransferase [Allgaiera indica]KDB03370.1 hypothetical protein U879_12370 [Defluviimonas sp. 20V17]GHD98583.1 hypothetical protein GCM10008024_02680 [Allgaiera indica]SDW10430.1 LPS sulfotransferase NodH [Allgaiera indica]
MRNHIVLTLGRSGSNTLCDMLNQSPEVLNYGEVLGHWTKMRKLKNRAPFLWRSDEAFVQWILTSRLLRNLANAERNLRKRREGKQDEIKRLAQVRTIGVKEFSLNFQRYGISERVLHRPGMKVIALVRRNVVDRMVSNARLGATGVVKVGGDDDDRGSGGLTIDPARIADLLRAIETENASLEQIIARLPEDAKYVIQYDDLYRDEDTRAAIMHDAFAFLGVAPIRPRTRMRKIITQPITEVIENFDACLDAVRGTHHEALLRAAAERATG